MKPDPFRHVPELRDMITPISETRFREGLLDMVRGVIAGHGLDPGFITTDADREAGRKAFLKGHDGDLWVFAYGSLMWDPAIHFEELRHARIEGYARRMCLYDDMGGRGGPDKPGLMAGLDAGPFCEGLAFRIAEDRVDRETHFLWSREMIAAGYLPRMLEAETPQGKIETVGFVADHTQPNIRPDLSHEAQVQYVATGEGILGSSFDYVDGLVTHFDLLGIDDPFLRRIWRDAKALRA